MPSASCTTATGLPSKNSAVKTSTWLKRRTVAVCHAPQPGRPGQSATTGLGGAVRAGWAQHRVPSRIILTMHVLAIDQGTSGTKAIVTDGSGRVLATAEEPLRPRYLDGGGVEQDPRELLDSVLEAGRRATAEAGVPLDAVALANQGETVLAWDRDTGHPRSPAIVWQDRRAEQICAERAAAAGRVAELTGLVLDPYFSA